MSESIMTQKARSDNRMGRAPGHFHQEDFQRSQGAEVTRAQPSDLPVPSSLAPPPSPSRRRITACRLFNVTPGHSSVRNGDAADWRGGSGCTRGCWTRRSEPRPGGGPARCERRSRRRRCSPRPPRTCGPPLISSDHAFLNSSAGSFTFRLNSGIGEG